MVRVLNVQQVDKIGTMLQKCKNSQNIPIPKSSLLFTIALTKWTNSQLHIVATNKLDHLTINYILLHH